MNYNKGDNIILSDIQFRFIKDGVKRRGGNHGGKGEISKNRYFLEFKYKQHYKEGFKRWGFEYDFRKKFFYNSFHPNSFIEIDYATKIA